ncbi:hypothetical protein [Plebeiibacterium marinum]|uniref:Uncharacterized protein n=1 Tax=Plebeiibacterium marinum TaxID=2992111 RepID=A0AAE3MDJ1_9BACT|nr:hypothetical protein [Plebeiobacterium marinum]MCW3805744.1 hypothetical protein [Plebeiobacterium marinum]
MKIIRVSPEIHDAFKKLCSREKKGITEGAELLINSALKKGTLKEVKQNVFNQIQSLDSTFRGWMKQQEKTHLRGISEDLLILSKRLKDVSTRTENEQLFKDSIATIENTTNKSLQHYESLLHEKIESRIELFNHLKKISKVLVVLIGLFFAINLSFQWLEDANRENSKNYKALREHCTKIEKVHKGIKILAPFDKKLEQARKSNDTKQKENVHKDN